MDKVNPFLTNANEIAKQSDDMIDNDNASVDTNAWTDTETITPELPTDHQNPQTNQNLTHQINPQPTTTQTANNNPNIHVEQIEPNNTNTGNSALSSAPMYIGAVSAEAEGYTIAECRNCRLTNEFATEDILRSERDVAKLNTKLKEKDEEIEKLKKKLEEDADRAFTKLAHAEAKRAWAVQFKDEEKKAKEEAEERAKVLEASVRRGRREKDEIIEENKILKRRLDAKQDHVQKLNSYQNVKNRQNNGDVKHYKLKCENFRFTLTQRDGTIERLVEGINVYNNIPDRSHSLNHNRIMRGGELDITLNNNVIVRERGQRGVDAGTDVNDLASSSVPPTELADFDQTEAKNKVNLDSTFDTLRSETEAVESLVDNDSEVWDQPIDRSSPRATLSFEEFAAQEYDRAIREQYDEETSSAFQRPANFGPPTSSSTPVKITVHLVIVILGILPEFFKLTAVKSLLP